MGFHIFPQSSFTLASSLLISYHFMSDMLLLLLHCSVLTPSSSSEPLEEHHVAQLLRRFSTDLSLGRHLCLDGAQAHHLHQCSYHLRLFRNWLISGQDPLEYFHGQPPWLCPSTPPASHPTQPLVQLGLCLFCGWFMLCFLMFLHACLFLWLCRLQAGLLWAVLEVCHCSIHCCQQTQLPNRSHFCLKWNAGSKSYSQINWATFSIVICCFTLQTDRN